MKTITKLFLVILSASSLILSTANAGELAVSGGATATYKTGGADMSTGKGIGVSNELDFTASGELDNGFTWKWQTQLDDAGTVNDDTRLEVGTPYGKVGFYISENDISSKLKYGIGAMGPGSDYGSPTTVQWGPTMNAYNNIGISTPSGLLPFGGSVDFAYAPNLSSTQGASAKASGTSETKAAGDDMMQVRIMASPIDGLSVGGDYATHSQASGATRYMASSGGVFAKYTTGPVSIGGARTEYEPTQLFSTGTTTNYDTNMYGIQFAVNDALSVSYSEEKSTLSSRATSSTNVVTTTDTSMKVKHMQAAYVVGGATIGLAIADADDSDYTLGKDEKTTILSVAMAF